MSPEVKAFILSALISLIVVATARAVERHREAKRHEHQQ